jgi:hypothetical protein
MSIGLEKITKRQKKPEKIIKKQVLTKQSRTQ